MQPMSTNLHGSMRDINLNLDDSCNCCCFGWRVRNNPDTQVYVTKSGDAVRFNRRLDQDNFSVKRTNINLLNAITQIALENKQDIDDIRKSLEYNSIILEDNSAITLETIRKINQIIKHMPTSAETSRQQSKEYEDYV